MGYAEPRWAWDKRRFCRWRTSRARWAERWRVTCPVLKCQIVGHGWSNYFSHTHHTPILSVSHISGLLRRLQQSSQPIKDGQDHLVVLCETVETIFRKGLKRKPWLDSLMFANGFDMTEPNSWFGINKQDYWCWIQTLPDYYFLDKWVLHVFVGVCVVPMPHPFMTPGRTLSFVKSFRASLNLIK